MEIEFIKYAHFLFTKYLFFFLEKNVKINFKYFNSYNRFYEFIKLYFI